MSHHAHFLEGVIPHHLARPQQTTSLRFPLPPGHNCGTIATSAIKQAGSLCKDLGNENLAFVLLNRYVDLTEAIEEGNASLLDNSDFAEATNVPLVDDRTLPTTQVHVGAAGGVSTRRSESLVRVFLSSAQRDLRSNVAQDGGERFAREWMLALSTAFQVSLFVAYSPGPASNLQNIGRSLDVRQNLPILGERRHNGARSDRKCTNMCDDDHSISRRNRTARK